MSFNNALTKTENIVFGRGVLYLALLDAAGLPLGERDLGETPGFTLTVASTEAKIYSSRAGIGQKILSATIQVDATAKIDVIDMSPENQALFIAGDVTSLSQASGAVTNERVYNLQSGREYQLGSSPSNVTGVRGVSAASIGIYEMMNAVAHATSTAYALGAIFKDATDVYVVTTAGTSAASAPTFNNTDIGDTTTDGAATVTYLGTTSVFSATTDYLLSAESGRFGVIPGSSMALACDLYEQTTGEYLSANAGYTKSANSRTQITSSGDASVIGQLRFIAANAIGDNHDLFIANCNVSPSGDRSFITSNSNAQFSLGIEVNSKDSATPQIIIDGRPV